MIQEWIEDRINRSVVGPPVELTQTPMLNKFWLPEMYFPNGLSASVVNAFQQVQKLTISQDGLMNFAQRVNAQFSCQLNLQNYPHDIQLCPIRMSTRKTSSFAKLIIFLTFFQQLSTIKAKFGLFGSNFLCIAQNIQFLKCATGGRPFVIVMKIRFQEIRAFEVHSSWFDDLVTT